MSEMSIQEEIEQLGVTRPHVVILGAGASLACLPDGDRGGKRLPLMNNVVSTLGLEDTLQRHSIPYDGENFEVLYSRIHEADSSNPVLAEIDASVRAYFSSLDLPDRPTIYDHLVLSLRPKDVVATFNWDPLLYKAYARNCRFAKLPKMFFLHGNVEIGFCVSHTFFRGTPGKKCRHCGGELVPSKLLFPIEKKNYVDDAFISGEWDALKHFLREAFSLTIFGYGAPRSDVEAVSLMKEVWSGNRTQEYNQTEIIDIRPREELEPLWDGFTFSHHYDIETSFYSSWIARHPRRSCEAIWNQFMEVKFIEDHSLPREADFDELYEWLEPLVNAEDAAENQSG